MTELQPLLESSDDDFELALLRSVRAEMPSPAGLHDTALALGLAASTAKALAATLPAGAIALGLGVQGVSVLPPTAGAGATLATTAGAGATLATSAAGGVSGGLASSASGAAAVASGTGTVGALGAVSMGAIGKSLFGGALMSFVALTAIDRVRTASSPPPASVTPTVRTAAAPRLQAPAAPQVAAIPMSAPYVVEPAAAPAPTVAPVNRRAASLAPKATPVKDARLSPPAPAKTAFAAEPSQGSLKAAANASLAAEIRTLDQTRAALAAGDTNRASQLLDAYAGNNPSATLSQEAALLRVRVLLNRGQRPAAAALARLIIAQHPESSHVESLRRLAAEP